jgi:hypothetical protein
MLFQAKPIDNKKPEEGNSGETEQIIEDPVDNIRRVSSLRKAQGQTKLVFIVISWSERFNTLFGFKVVTVEKEQTILTVHAEAGTHLEEDCSEVLTKAGPKKQIEVDLRSPVVVEEERKVSVDVVVSILEDILGQI